MLVEMSGPNQSSNVSNLITTNECPKSSPFRCMTPTGSNMSCSMFAAAWSTADSQSVKLGLARCLHSMAYGSVPIVSVLPSCRKLEVPGPRRSPPKARATRVSNFFQAALPTITPCTRYHPQNSTLRNPAALVYPTHTTQVGGISTVGEGRAAEPLLGGSCRPTPRPTIAPLFSRCAHYP